MSLPSIAQNLILWLIKHQINQSIFNNVNAVELVNLENEGIYHTQGVHLYELLRKADRMCGDIFIQMMQKTCLFKNVLKIVKLP